MKIYPKKSVQLVISLTPEELQAIDTTSQFMDYLDDRIREHTDHQCSLQTFYDYSYASVYDFITELSQSWVAFEERLNDYLDDVTGGSNVD